jgi:hypothetical protein
MNERAKVNQKLHFDTELALLSSRILVSPVRSEGPRFQRVLFAEIDPARGEEERPAGASGRDRGALRLLGEIPHRQLSRSSRPPDHRRLQRDSHSLHHRPDSTGRPEKVPEDRGVDEEDASAPLLRRQQERPRQNPGTDRGGPRGLKNQRVHHECTNYFCF